MALGLPDRPPEDILDRFVESQDDETCPTCGWDREEAAQDPHRAFNQGILLAIEQSEGSPFTAQSATTLNGFYWRCPNKTVALDPIGEDTQFVDRRCGTLFTTEEEVTLGAMA